MVDINYQNIIKSEIVLDSIDALNENLVAHSVNLLHVNIRRLNANFDKLEILVKSLKVKPDVIVCSESGIIKSLSFFKLEGYEIYYNESQNNLADGVVLYVKSNINHSVVLAKHGQVSFLSCIISLKLTQQLMISTSYRCHKINKEVYIKNLKAFLNENIKVVNHCLVGDFNLDILTNDKSSEIFLNNFLEKGYQPLFTNITRPNNTNCRGGTCIDNIFLKTALIEHKAFTLTSSMTDHYSLFGSFLISSVSESEEKSYSKINFGKLLRYGSEEDWECITHLKDMDDATDVFIGKIKRIMHKSMSNEKIKKSKARKSWITSGIITSCKTKEKLFIKKTKNRHDNALKKKYRDYSNCLDKVIRSAKIMFERNEIKKRLHNKKKLWQFVNDKINDKNKKKKVKISHLIINKQKIVNEHDICNNFNKFFSEVGEKLANQIQSPRVAQRLKKVKTNEKSIFLSPTNCHEVQSLIFSMSNKAGGYDGIPVTVLKALSPYIIDPLVYIFNSCIASSYWPKSLKAAEILPLHKSKEKHLMNNYRPISLISNIAKIFEKLIKIRLLNSLKVAMFCIKINLGFVKISVRSTLYNWSQTLFTPNSIRKLLPLLRSWIYLKLSTLLITRYYLTN